MRGRISGIVLIICLAIMIKESLLCNKNGKTNFKPLVVLAKCIHDDESKTDAENRNKCMPKPDKDETVVSPMNKKPLQSLARAKLAQKPNEPARATNTKLLAKVTSKQVRTFL